MKAALLLIDIQNDYLKPNLFPPLNDLIATWTNLLDSCRQQNLPVYHVRTQIAADGRNAMPHRRKSQSWQCVLGTSGYEPPPELEALQAETVLAKPFFSVFGNPDLQSLLQEQGVDTLLIAGVYTHACIHASVLDAYQAGFKVILIEDGVGSHDALHAQLSLDYLGSRTCQILSLAQIQAQLWQMQAKSIQSTEPLSGLSYYQGQWQSASHHALWQTRNPSCWNEILTQVPLSRKDDIEPVMQILQSSNWGKSALATRISILQQWHQQLTQNRTQFIYLLAQEVGKASREAAQEVTYALNLLASTIKLLQSPEDKHTRFQICYHPIGTVALITPWNNPLAIPVGKLSPALGFGNTVIWKPALQAPQIVELLVKTLRESGLPDDCLGVIQGDAQSAVALAKHKHTQAVSLTGSVAAGQMLAPLCAHYGKDFQGELGGNNAVIVSAYKDISTLARELARAVYSFAGQRCTAPRRLIVLPDVLAEFSKVFVAEAQSLKLGLPQDPQTDIGPLISRQAQQRMIDLVAQSIQQGARLLCGGRPIYGDSEGCWFEPTLLTDVAPDSQVFQAEAFGPVAVLMPASDFEQALQLCNAVDYGLMASLYSDHPQEQTQFLEQAQAGILRVNQPQGFFDPQAPFSGWKLSGIGIPEHGVWDRDFYTRTQTVYHSFHSDV